MKYVACYQELQQQLAHEKDSRQHELSALQDAQTHKISQMRKKHKEEIGQLKAKMQEMDWGSEGWESQVCLRHVIGTGHIAELFYIL